MRIWNNWNTRCCWQETIWQFVINKHTYLLCGQAIPLLDSYLREIKHKNVCPQRDLSKNVLTLLFITATTWNHKCLSTGEWINYSISIGEYYSTT